MDAASVSTGEEQSPLLDSRGPVSGSQKASPLEQEPQDHEDATKQTRPVDDGDVDVIRLIDSTEDIDGVPEQSRLSASASPVAEEPKKQAWALVVPVSPPFPNIFEFIPEPEPPKPELLPSDPTIEAPDAKLGSARTYGTPISIEIPSGDTATVSSIPGYAPLDLRVDTLDGLRIAEALQAEKTYVVPKDWIEFGWREIYQLGLCLSYKTMLLRRDISARYLVLDEDNSVDAAAFRPLSSAACEVLAAAGLPFNHSTEELVIRQRLPAPKPKPKNVKKKKRKNNRRYSSSPKRKYLVLPKLPSPLRLGIRTPQLPSPPRLSLPMKLPSPSRLQLPITRVSPRRHRPQQTIPSTKQKIGDLGASAIFRALRVNTSLLSLTLSNAGLTDVSAGALAAMLRVNCTLTELSLHRNSITHIGIQIIGEALEDSPDSVLIRLDLSRNKITDEGVPALCHALEENETLVWLDLSWNQLSSKALLSILNTLRGNFVLRELSIFGKDLDEDQYTLNLESKYAKDIAAALRQVNASLANVRLSSETALLPVDKLKSSRWLSLPSRNLMELDALVISGLMPLNDRLLSLDLSDNRGIERWAILEVLKSIKHCKTLKHVNLANTGLYEEVGEQVGDLIATNLTLETIIMHDQELHVQQIRGKDPVEVLSFSVDKDHFFDRWILAKCLVLNRATQELNQLRLPQAKAPLITGATPTKVSINYSLRKLELYEVVFLARKIFYHLAIGRVSLNGCGITSHGGVALADGVRNHASLEILEIENNQIGVPGGCAMAECVSYNASLTFLNLSWNKIGNDGIVGFEDALKANKSLRRLDLRGNALSAVGIKAIAAGLKGNACLQELYLRWNTVCPAGAEALAQALTVNKTLRLLDIEHHTMGARGASAFASMLAKNNRLQELNMKGDDAISDGDANGIGSEATKLLAATLVDKNKTLTIFSIAQNQIGRDGIMRFCDVVKFNKTIQVLDLSISEMDGKIADRFFECLAMNKTITKLNLAHNRISNEGMMACIRLLDVNRVLHTLNLAHNAITEEPLALLAAKWQKKKQQLHQPVRPGMNAVVPGSSSATAPLSLKWLCLTGNTMTERTRQALKSIEPMVTIELEEELHQMPEGR